MQTEVKPLRKGLISAEDLSDAERRVLSKSFLFAGLPEQCLREAVGCCSYLYLPEKTEIYRRGEPGEEMCIVLNGTVKISTHSADGKEIIFDLLGTGEFFGELSLLDGSTRTATVTTLVPSVLAVLKRGFFLNYLEENPAISLRLLRLLARRLRGADALLEEVLFLDSEARLAKRIIALKDLYGKAAENQDVIELRISQQDVANLVGVTREMVNKLLKKWEKENVIRLGAGCLFIQRSDTLQKLAGEVT